MQAKAERLSEAKRTHMFVVMQPEGQGCEATAESQTPTYV